LPPTYILYWNDQFKKTGTKYFISLSPPPIERIQIVLLLVVLDVSEGQICLSNYIIYTFFRAQTFGTGRIRMSGSRTIPIPKNPEKIKKFQSGFPDRISPIRSRKIPKDPIRFRALLFFIFIQILFVIFLIQSCSLFKMLR
jgi:hypothetical protein